MACPRAVGIRPGLPSPPAVPRLVRRGPRTAAVRWWPARRHCARRRSAAWWCCGGAAVVLPPGVCRLRTVCALRATVPAGAVRRASTAESASRRAWLARDVPGVEPARSSVRYHTPNCGASARGSPGVGMRTTGRCGRPTVTDDSAEPAVRTVGTGGSARARPSAGRERRRAGHPATRPLGDSRRLRPGGHRPPVCPQWCAGLRDRAHHRAERPLRSPAPRGGAR